MFIAIIVLTIVCCSLLACILYVLRGNREVYNDVARLKERYEMADAQKNDLANELAMVRSERDEAVLAQVQLQERLSHSDADLKRLNAHIEHLTAKHEKELMLTTKRQEELIQQSEANFRLMANDIMERHTATMRQQNEQRLGEILTPLKENIDKFRHDVSECYSAEARERFSLQEKIKELIETNNNIGREAKELTTALRGNSKKQGDWGELVLESILENSGLRRGEEFTVQQQSDEFGNSLRDDDGRGLRPDVVVHYPGGRAMIIDSKVSLTAFVDFVNCEDTDLQEQHGKRHLQSVLKHINELSAKNYQNYVGTEKLDFVMMFIPNEAAYSAAMTLDPTLWQKAYDKRVLIVSPTQLVGSLRLIKQLWSHDRQTRNAIEIAEKSGQMYDKFVGFLTDMEKIEKSLASTQSAYDNAMKKLQTGTGNLISRAEKLRELGIKTTKKLASRNQSDDE